MEKMTKIERAAAAVSGEKPDRVPYSFWTHLPGIDLDPVLLAEKTYEFYKEYDIDVIKTMNNGMYAVEDFGCTVDYSEIQKGGTAKIDKAMLHFIRTTKDEVGASLCAEAHASAELSVSFGA